MDLAIKRINIELTDRGCNSYHATAGRFQIEPAVDDDGNIVPGKWTVSFDPHHSPLETTLDLEGAQGLIEQLSNVKRMISGIEDLFNEHKGEVQP